jgi:hypothetical protein
MEKISLNELRNLIRKIMGRKEGDSTQDSNKKVRIKKLEDGLVMSSIKHYYPWFLRADIEDAVVGIEGKYIKWYSGTWHDGVWANGIFMGGTFAGGTWKNGEFNGDIFDGDRWENGYFEGGTFTGKVWEYGNFNAGTFAGEIWKDGLWKTFGDNAPVWKGGKWENGMIRYIDKSGGEKRKETSLNPKEFFKGGDKSKYSIKKSGDDFILTYKDHYGKKDEKVFNSRGAAENFAKFL